MSENDEPIDSTTVTWPFDLVASLPSSATYSAGTLPEALYDPEMELRIIDLLYSALDEGYYRDDREQQLGVMSVAKHKSQAFKEAQAKLLQLSLAVIPNAVYANVIEGLDSYGKPVYGLIAFYEKEEVTNGTVHE